MSCFWAPLWSKNSLCRSVANIFSWRFATRKKVQCPRLFHKFDKAHFNQKIVFINAWQSLTQRITFFGIKNPSSVMKISVTSSVNSQIQIQGQQQQLQHIRKKIYNSFVFKFSLRCAFVVSVCYGVLWLLKLPYFILITPRTKPQLGPTPELVLLIDVSRVRKYWKSFNRFCFRFNSQYFLSKLFWKLLSFIPNFSSVPGVIRWSPTAVSIIRFVSSVKNPSFSAFFKRSFQTNVRCAFKGCPSFLLLFNYSQLNLRKSMHKKRKSCFRRVRIINIMTER